MGELLRANVRAHSRRYTATALAVAISMAFIVVALALSSGLNASLTKSVRDQYAGADAVVTLDYEDPEAGEHPLSEYSSAIQGASGVDSVREDGYGAWDITTTDGRISPSVSVAYNQQLASGELPSGSGELALSQADADSLGVTVGDDVTVTNAFDNSQSRTLRVSGVLEASSSMGTIDPDVVTTPQTLRALDSTYEPDTFYVAGSGDLVSAIRDAAPDSALSVKTADQAIDDDLSQMQMGQGTMMAFMLVFPVIALAVAAIVVSTTFRIIFEQRRRELALLRTLGATSRQVRGMIRGETIMVGAISSAIGVVLGAVLGAFVLLWINVADSVGEGFSMLDIGQILIVWVVGTLLTFLIGTRPAKSVTSVSPMEALIPIDATATARSHRTRTIIGALITVAGLAGLYLGIKEGEDAGFLIAFGSGVMCFIGALLVCSVLLPKFTYLIGAPLRSVVGVMARSNTVRNPERTGSTGTAIILGVTLITTMAVAAGSMRESLLSEVDSQRPYDLVAEGGNLSDNLAERIGTIEGVDNTVAVTGVDATLDGDTLTVIDGQAGQGSDDSAESGGDDEDGAMDNFSVLAQPNLNPVAHSKVPVISDGEARVPSYLDLDSLNLCGANQCVSLDVTLDDSIDDINVSPTTLAQVTDNASVRQIYIKLTQDADTNAVQNSITSMDTNLDVGGTAAERAMYTQIINSVLMVIVGLLAVSVLVALVGVANTLSLSVFERTRENGLLRALGLTKKQMRRMLVLEATLISGSSTIIGVALGIFFGAMGTLALPFDLSDTIIVIPWWQILAVIVIAVLSAVIASITPGRKAAKVSPVEALAA